MAFKGKTSNTIILVIKNTTKQNKINRGGVWSIFQILKNYNLKWEIENYSVHLATVHEIAIIRHCLVLREYQQLRNSFKL